MAYLNLANRGVVRAIDAALDKTWDQCREAEQEKKDRDKREKEHGEILDRALSRMKSGPRERFINSRNEHGSALQPRFLNPDEVKKMKCDDAGYKDFKDAISEPVAVRRHLPEGVSSDGQNMAKAIGELSGKRR